MKKSTRNLILVIVGIVCSGYLLSLRSTQEYDKLMSKSRYQSRNKVIKKPAVIAPGCRCTSSKTGEHHNFCYTDPQNSTSIGKRFDCSSLVHLENLGIVYSEGTVDFVDIQNPVRDEKEVIFTGACSDDHLNEEVASLKAIQSLYPNQKFILYGLNLTEKSQEQIKAFKNVKLRSFDASKYPKFATNWKEYRFKPLIIAEVLKEHKNIWWMDAHIRNKNAEVTKMLYKDMANQENGLKSSIVFFTNSGHSNFAVLIPKLLSYFPTNSVGLLKHRNSTQLGANRMYFARTEFTMEMVKWWVLCALDQECMNPPGATIFCKFDKNRFEYFGSCFRFDQSVMNLLLFNEYQHYRHYYNEKVAQVY